MVGGMRFGLHATLDPGAVVPKTKGSGGFGRLGGAAFLHRRAQKVILGLVCNGIWRVHDDDKTRLFPSWPSAFLRRCLMVYHAFTAFCCFLLLGFCVNDSAFLRITG
jgi:hypothetical protein